MKKEDMNLDFTYEQLREWKEGDLIHLILELQDIIIKEL
jgi:hypothetical protein